MLFASCYSLSSYALKLIIDSVASSGTNQQDLLATITFPALLYVGLNFSFSPIVGLYDWLTIRTFPPMKAEITKEMFSYVEGHSYSYFQKAFSGSLSNKINDMSRSASVVIYDVINHFFSRFLSLVIGAFTLYLVHPDFAWVIIGWSLIFVTIAYYLSKKALVYSESFSESRSAVVGKIVDSLSNILNVKLFAREHDEEKLLNEYLDTSVKKDQARLWYLLKVKFFYTLSIGLLITIIMGLLVRERYLNQVTVGDFALVLSLTLFLTEQFFFVATLLVSFYEDVGSCQQALSIISPKQEILNTSEAAPLVVGKGEIVFDKVHFQYLKNQRLFSDKSIVLKPGEKVGLVGSSGSGKSTFVNLILRFFDVKSGKILIDGQNIKDVTQESLRSQVAMIPQDPILFHRSIMENIRYGKLDATDEEVIECAKKAYCHDFIEKLPQKYQTLVGERGVKLSGGERQRIAIARAILKNAPILILDEATSSLDSMTENCIQESLSKLIEGKTTIIIAHRLSTLSLMDRILVFSEGKVVEDGTHSTLINVHGNYEKLWSMQANGFLKDPKNGNNLFNAPLLH